MTSTSDEPPVETIKQRRTTNRKAGLSRAIKAALAAGLRPAEVHIAPDGSIKLTFATGDDVAPSPQNDWD